MRKKQNTDKSTYMQRILSDRVLMRLEIVRRYYAGEKPAYFASEFDITPRRAYYIIEAFEKHGWRGLIDNRGGAYRVKITDDIERQIVEAFVSNPASKGKDIAPLLEKQNIVLNERSIDRVLEKHFLKKKVNIKNNKNL